ncbi:hypothetical protein KCTC52924_02429 [Arenibacter antarcticus]|uniref:Lysophospholipid acyltransferase family protein n=1 Tax=Arenibacter antarcticus TaxID=2040469 RepID=A0ABW5VJI5_9FLAO|nr:lysophospholipid acyltransferase family protein [Arenibacter sp. H213]
MRKLGYFLIRLWIRSSLWIYFSKISINGLGNIPKDKPLLFLANHQNALLDALLVAAHGPRKIYFLTRSDVFKNPILKRIFEFLQMIPIYRIRDGKESLKENAAVFDRCSKLLQKGEAILIFPEGNHSLKRRVRPLSKGFTRFLFAALEDNPLLDIRLVPVGMNYVDAAAFPDLVSVCYGKDIRVLDFYDREALVHSVNGLKKEVHQKLSKLTTHIENVKDHDEIVAKLKGQGIDFSCPETANQFLKHECQLSDTLYPQGEISMGYGVLKALIALVNFPIILIWSMVIRPKVKELEFLSTVRFMVFLLFFPGYYLLLTLILWYFTGIALALSIGGIHLLLNLLLIKLLGASISGRP